jgi:CMP/dCMP kinase
MIITVGGQAASGKTTLAKALAKELGFAHVSAGNVMREMAKEAGMTLLEFSRYAEGRPEIDREIDERQKRQAKGDCVVDGRLSRFFLDPDLSIWLVAPAKVRAERVVGRGEKYKTVKDALAEMTLRDESERKRYMEFYRIDLGDLSAYDMVINTGRFDIAGMTRLALAATRSLKG